MNNQQNQYEKMGLMARALTRREVKTLKGDDLSLFNINPEKIDETVDRVLGIVLTPEGIDILDDLPYGESTVFFRAVMDETFGSKVQEKNLSSSGRGVPTGTESDTASNADE